MDARQGKKHGGSRKYGRNEAKCKRYRAEGRREKNKRRRMKRLEKKYAKNRERRAGYTIKDDSPSNDG